MSFNSEKVPGVRQVRFVPNRNLLTSSRSSYEINIQHGREEINFKGRILWMKKRKSNFPYGISKKYDSEFQAPGRSLFAAKRRHSQIIPERVKKRLRIFQDSKGLTILFKIEA